jgi:mannose-6-phosphate isomerase-like protein (cupin superfamily)
MATGSLPEMASALADVWKSLKLGKVGGANIKLIKMGGQGIPDESHADFAELLVVIEGRMTLIVDGTSTALETGDFYLIPKGTTHSVPPGSHGTLLLVDTDE